MPVAARVKVTMACVRAVVGAAVVVVAVVAVLTVPLMAPAIVVVVAVTGRPTGDVATMGRPGKEISKVRLKGLVASKLFDLINVPVRVLV